MNKPHQGLAPELQGKIHSIHFPHSVEEAVLKEGAMLTRRSLQVALVGLQRNLHLDPQTVEGELRRLGIQMPYAMYHAEQLSSGMVMHDKIDTMVEVRDFAKKKKQAQRQAV